LLSGRQRGPEAGPDGGAEPGAYPLIRGSEHRWRWTSKKTRRRTGARRVERLQAELGIHWGGLLWRGFEKRELGRKNRKAG